MNSRKSLIIVLFFIVLVIGGSATLYTFAYPYIHPQVIVQSDSNQRISTAVKDVNMDFNQDYLLKATIKKQGLENSEYYRNHVPAASSTDLFTFSIGEYIQKHGLVGLSNRQKSTFKSIYLAKVWAKLVENNLTPDEANSAMSKVKLPFK